MKFVASNMSRIGRWLQPTVSYAEAPKFNSLCLHSFVLSVSFDVLILIVSLSQNTFEYCITIQTLFTSKTTSRSLRYPVAIKDAYHKDRTLSS